MTVIIVIVGIQRGDVEDLEKHIDEGCNANSYVKRGGLEAVYEKSSIKLFEIILYLDNRV